MKKPLFFIVSIFVITTFIFAQTTITIQPNAANGKDALIASCISCGYSINNYGSHKDFAAVAWTNGGAISNARALIDFDLSAIPSNAIITDAKLSLYHYASPFNIGHSQLTGANTAYLRKINDAWSENTVTWDNQPSTSTVNQVLLNASANDTQDYINISVTALINDIFNSPNHGNGMMMVLDTESFYRSLLFASSDALNSALHPKLEITYAVTSQTTSIANEKVQFKLYPNPSNGLFNIDYKNDIDFSQHIVVSDAAGKVIKDKSLVGLKMLDLSDLSDGIYFYQIISSTIISEQQKLVIHK